MSEDSISKNNKAFRTVFSVAVAALSYAAVQKITNANYAPAIACGIMSVAADKMAENIFTDKKPIGEHTTRYLKEQEQKSSRQHTL